MLRIRGRYAGNAITREIPVQGAGERPGQPHAHWMGPDGHTMSTPNSNTDDSTLLDVPADREVLMRWLRLLETEPSLLGASSHLLGLARRP